MFALFLPGIFLRHRYNEMILLILFFLYLSVVILKIVACIEYVEQIGFIVKRIL